MRQAIQHSDQGNQLTYLGGIMVRLEKIMWDNLLSSWLDKYLLLVCSGTIPKPAAIRMLNPGMVEKVVIYTIIKAGHFVIVSLILLVFIIFCCSLSWCQFALIMGEICHLKIAFTIIVYTFSDSELTLSIPLYLIFNSTPLLTNSILYWHEICNTMELNILHMIC